MAFDLLDQVESGLRVNRVGIVEFAESSDYCGKRLYPGQRVLLKLIFAEELVGWEEDILTYWERGGRGGGEIQIAPFMRDRVAHLREHNYSHFREVNLVGGRRSSKGFVTGIAMAKVMYDCMQLQNPGDYYGIDEDKNIMFNCVAGSQDQAKEFQFADFVSTVESCKAFERNLVKSLETELRVAVAADHRKSEANRKRGSQIMHDIARLRGKALASNAGTLRGSASMITTIDEMAHMLPGESKASADTVYNAAEPALAQFKGDGMMFLNSSPYTKVGKFFERNQEAMKIAEDKLSPVDPTLFAMQFPSWALFEHWEMDPERRFRGAITVSPDWDPDEKTDEGEYRFTPEDRKQIDVERKNEAADPDTYKVERRGQWAEVVDSFLIPEMVDRMFSGRPTGYDENQKVILQPYAADQGEGAHNYFRYAAHLDPSSTTAGFGFALGHLEYFEHADGKEHPHVVFDVIKRWQASEFPDRVIDWEPIKLELITYIDFFRPFQVTFDQYQSNDPIQDIQRRLLAQSIRETRVFEITATPESNWRRAETTKTALYQGLLHAPSLGPTHRMAEDQEWSALEMKFLQQVNTNSKYPKVDKQTMGPVQTKDMADCIFTVSHVLIGDIISRGIAEQLATSPMRVGAMGGYRIGGPDAGGRGLPSPGSAGYYNGGRIGEQMRTGPERRGSVGRGAGRGRTRGISGSRRRGR